MTKDRNTHLKLEERSGLLFMMCLFAVVCPLHGYLSSALIPQTKHYSLFFVEKTKVHREVKKLIQGQLVVVTESNQHLDLSYRNIW